LNPEYEEKEEEEEKRRSNGKKIKSESKRIKKAQNG
jgi:hypothetical protein